MTHQMPGTPPEPTFKHVWRMALGSFLAIAALFLSLPGVPLTPDDPWYVRTAETLFRAFLVFWGTWLGWSTVITQNLRTLVELVVELWTKFRRGKDAAGRPRERRRKDG